MTPPKAVNPDGLWLDDFSEGQTFSTDSYEVTQEEVIAFASQYDPQAYHLSEEGARGTFFDGLAASGWHTAAITMRLLSTSGIPIATGIIGTDISLKWQSATRPGDVLHLEITVQSVTRSSSRPDRGNVVVAYDTLNQRGEVRQSTVARSLAWARPTTAVAPELD